MKLPAAATGSLILLSVLFVTRTESRAAGPSSSSVVPQESESTITVTATGTFLVQPSYLSMKAVVTANAPMAEEALTDFAQSVARMKSALEANELEGLTTQGRGLKLQYMPEPDKNSNAAMNAFVVSGSTDELQYGVTCSEGYEVRFAPPAEVQAQREVAALALDTVVDLGLRLERSTQSTNTYTYVNGRRVDTPPAAVQGDLEDQARVAAENQAQELAMQRAHAMASHLAELSGRPLGPILSVSLQSVETGWKGVGIGVEAKAVVRVTFELR